MNTTSSVRRAQQERIARIVLACGLAPVLPCAAVIIWVLGYSVRPYQPALGFVTAGIAAVVGIAGQLAVYHVKMKRARQL